MDRCAGREIANVEQSVQINSWKRNYNCQVYRGRRESHTDGVRVKEAKKTWINLFFKGEEELFWAI